MVLTVSKHHQDLWELLSLFVTPFVTIVTSCFLACSVRSDGPQPSIAMATVRSPFRCMGPASADGLRQVQAGEVLAERSIEGPEVRAARKWTSQNQ